MTDRSLLLSLRAKVPCCRCSVHMGSPGEGGYLSAPTMCPLITMAARSTARDPDLIRCRW